jgi:hypothetical protein
MMIATVKPNHNMYGSMEPCILKKLDGWVLHAARATPVGASI